MYNNGCANTNGNCCSTLSCTGRILAVLTIILGLVVGVIIGFLAAAFIGMALIPLIIFAAALLLAILLIFFFARCNCRRND